MKRLLFLAIVVLLCLGVGLVISCGGGDDDDDDDSSDDDTGEDDDDDDDIDDDDDDDDDTTDYYLDFDGATGEALTDSGITPQLDTDLTVEGWFWFDLADPIGIECLISQFALSKKPLSTPRGYMLYRHPTDDEIHFCVANGSNESCADSDIVVQAGTWVHLAGTWDDALGKVDVFLGGAEGDSMTGAAYSPTDEPLYLGHSPDYYFYFDGRSDNVRISNTVRYTGDFEPEQSFETDADTAALYDFNEGQGLVAHDQTENGNHLNLSGGVTWEEQPAAE